MVFRMLPKIEDTIDGLSIVSEMLEHLFVSLSEFGEMSETVFHSGEKKVEEDYELVGVVDEGNDGLGLGFSIEELEDL